MTHLNRQRNTGEHGPTVEGHLEYDGHRNATETTVRYYTDQHYHQQSDEKGTSTGPREVNPDIELLILLVCLI